MFAFQIFQNVGMTMGIMPITGIPLPFMSHGGSSTVMAFSVYWASGERGGSEIRRALAPVRGN